MMIKSIRSHQCLVHLATFGMTDCGMYSLSLSFLWRPFFAIKFLADGPFFFSILPSFPWVLATIAASVSETDEPFGSLDIKSMSFGGLPSRRGDPYGQSSGGPIGLLASRTNSFRVQGQGRNGGSNVFSEIQHCHG